MRLFVIILFSCSPFLLLAQNDQKTLVASASKDSSTATESVAPPKDTLASGQLDSLKTTYLLAFQENPTYIPAIDRLAGLYRNLGMLDSTIYYYQRSLDLAPDGIIARQSLAAAHFVEGNHAEAIEHYRTLQQQHPDYPEAYNGLARVYFAQKDYQKAIDNSEVALRWYLMAKKNLHAAEVRLLAGQAYMHLRAYKTAIKYFKASKKHFRTKGFYHYYIGYCLLKLDKEKEAEKYLSEAKKLGYQLPTYVEDELEE